MANLNELHDKRSRLATEMNALYQKTETEDRGFSADERVSWDKMKSDIAELDVRISDAEEADKQNRYLNASRGTMSQHQADSGTQNAGGDVEVNESRVFMSWVKRGMSGLNDAERGVMQKRLDTSSEVRALAAGTNNAGGYTVAPEFMNSLETAMKAYGGMLEAGEVIRTDTGATLPMPTLNFTNVVASIVGENTQSTLDTSTPFGIVNIGAYTYRSLVLPVSYEFLQDSAFSENSIIQPWAEQFGRGLNAHLTNGTGIGQPQGIVPAAASGAVAATGNTTKIVWTDITKLEHSIDPAYRSGSKWMFHDSTLKVLKDMLDGQNRPLFLPDVKSAAYDTILRYPFVINQDMPVMAANAKSILFGRLDKYKIRMVKDLTMLRLTERYADFLQVGFLGFMRADGKLLDAGANPVKYYQNSAT